MYPRMAAETRLKAVPFVNVREEYLKVYSKR